MRLRFRILSPNDTGAPAYTTCGQASSVVDFNDLKLTVKVDGTDIINTLDFAAETFPYPNVTTTNGLIVSGIDLVDLYYIEMEIGLNNIWDSTTLSIEAVNQDTNSYSNIFEIYGYDLGNNPNQSNTQGNPIDYNPTMDIVLLKNNIPTHAYTHFTMFRHPYTDKVYYYDLTNNIDEVYYENILGERFNGRNGSFCKKETCGLKQINNIYEYINCVRTLVSTCSSSLLQAETLTLIPEFNITTDCTLNCATDCQTTIESESKATTYIDYTNLSYLWVNDVFKFPYDTQTINYEIVDFTGNVISNQDYVFSVGYNGFIYDPNLYEFNNFILPEKGDYLLKTVIGVNDVWSCLKTIKLTSCHWYEIKKDDCNNYTVFNNAFEEVTLEVFKLSKDKIFESISTTIIPQLTKLNVEHSTDGIYQYKVTRNEISYIYLVFNYCEMQKCLLDVINKTICPTQTKCGCSPSKDSKCELYYDFNSKITNAITYFNMLNSEYNFNFMYESITPNKLNELYDIQLILDRFNEYCTKTDCKCS